MVSWTMSCCIDRIMAQCTVAAPEDGALPNVADVPTACVAGVALAAGESCLVECNEGYECSAEPCQLECSATSVLTAPTCSPRSCTMQKPTFGDWGTCVATGDPSTISRAHGDDCFIRCAVGYIGNPRQTVVPAGQQGPASRWAIQTCTLGVLGGPGPGATCVEPQNCELREPQLPPNSSWGTCTTAHPTDSSSRSLNHGESCRISCHTNFNLSTASDALAISCDDGNVTNNMRCEYTNPPEPEPEPSAWADEGNWVIYDTEGTEVLECTSADDATYRFTVPATGEGCPDSALVTAELAKVYDDQYEAERSGLPCVWDPFFYNEYPSAAGINLTLAWAYEDMEAQWLTRTDFQTDFEYEMVRSLSHRGCPSVHATLCHPSLLCL